MRPSTEQIEKYKSDNPDEVKTHDISGVEIFSIGTWNGDGYSSTDLDAMAESFSALGDKLKPYLKLGHGEGQGLLKSDELPAAGWVKGVRRMGNKLVADFVGVPRKIYQLLKAGAYKRLSVEIYPRLKVDGKEYRNALKAVALLGGETPAVQNLNDILALYAACGPVAAFSNNEDGAAVKVYEYNPALAGENGDKTMNDLEAAKARIAALEKENADLKSGELKKFADENKSLKAEAAESAKTIKAEKDRADAAEAKVKEYADAAEAREIESAVSDLIAKKKIAPAQKEAVSAMLKGAKSQVNKFSVGGKEKSMSEIVKEFFSAAPDLDLNTDTESEAGEKLNLDLAAEAKKYADANKVSFDDALIAVSLKREKRA